MTTPTTTPQPGGTFAPRSFYDAEPTELDGAPGSIIRSLALSAPRGVRAWAVLYRSMGQDGSNVPVSGMVLAPAATGSGSPGPTPTFGIDGQPILAWAHGTTGLADPCAPSRDGVNGLGYDPLLPLVRGGFVITATDYEGLGTAGIHPYLVGSSEGRSVLDSIRAAQELVMEGAVTPTVVIGISQGGHAALWAGELADAYAPELNLTGVVAASPPMDLRAVQRAVIGSGEAGEVAWLESLMVAAAWRSVYRTPLEGFLTDEGLRIVRELEDSCPGSITPPAASPFRVDPGTVPEWQALLESNSPGHRASRPPILVLAATQDVLVPRSTIPLGIDRLCGAGSSVELRWIEGGHAATLADPAGAAAALTWSIDRLRGELATSDCE